MNVNNIIFCNNGADAFNADAVVAVSKADRPNKSSVLVCLLGNRTLEIHDMRFEEVIKTILNKEKTL